MIMLILYLIPISNLSVQMQYKIWNQNVSNGWIKQRKEPLFLWKLFKWKLQVYIKSSIWHYHIFAYTKEFALKSFFVRYIYSSYLRISIVINGKTLYNVVGTYVRLISYVAYHGKYMRKVVYTHSICVQITKSCSGKENPSCKAIIICVEVIKQNCNRETYCF